MPTLSICAEDPSKGIYPKKNKEEINTDKITITTIQEKKSINTTADIQQTQATIHNKIERNVPNKYTRLHDPNQINITLLSPRLSKTSR